MIVALVVAMLLAAPTAWATGQTPLAAGGVAPETVLPDQRGQTVRLGDLLQQRDFVVVAFYVKAFTGG